MTPTPTPQRPDARVTCPDCDGDRYFPSGIICRLCHGDGFLPAAPAVALEWAMEKARAFYEFAPDDGTLNERIHAKAAEYAHITAAAKQPNPAVAPASAVGDALVKLSVAFLDGYLPEATQNHDVLEHWDRIKAALAAPSDAQPAQAVTDAMRTAGLEAANLCIRTMSAAGNVKVSSVSDVDCEAIYLAMERARSAQAEGVEVCEHEWVSGDNERVKNASVCMKCHMIQPCSRC